jgi:hypothetical protein
MNEIKPILDALSEPFDPKEVSFRAGATSGNRALALAYIDARNVMDRLDAVVGGENWWDSYEVLADGCVECALTLDLMGARVRKVDVGGPSDQQDPGDRMKAAYSDSLKRAAVKFGVGRYLYALENQWVGYDPMKKRLTEDPKLPQWALPRPKVSASLRTAALAILEPAAKIGRPEFELAWRTVSPEMRKAVQGDLPQLKLYVEAAGVAFNGELKESPSA